MKKVNIILMSLCIIICCFVLGGCYYDYSPVECKDTDNEQFEKINNSLEELSNTNRELNEYVKSLEESIKNLQNQVNELENEKKLILLEEQLLSLKQSYETLLQTLQENEEQNKLLINNLKDEFYNKIEAIIQSNETLINSLMTKDENITTRFEPLTNNIFNGKKLCVFGDSITAGVGTTAPYYFADLLGEKLSFSSVNRIGYSGYAFSHGIEDYGNCILDVMEEALTKVRGNCDVLIIALGVNDWTWGRSIEGDRAIGNLLDNTKYTFCGALNLFCQKLQTLFVEYPDTKIYFTTPMPTSWNPLSGGSDNKSWDQSKTNYNGNTLRDYCKAIIETVTLYGYQTLDVNLLINSDLESNEMGKNFKDGLHPNELGNEYLADIIANLLIANPITTYKYNPLKAYYNDLLTTIVNKENDTTNNDNNVYEIDLDHIELGHFQLEEAEGENNLRYDTSTHSLIVNSTGWYKSSYIKTPIGVGYQIELTTNLSPKDAQGCAILLYKKEEIENPKKIANSYWPGTSVFGLYAPGTNGKEAIFQWDTSKNNLGYDDSILYGEHQVIIKLTESGVKLFIDGNEIELNHNNGLSKNIDYYFAIHANRDGATAVTINYIGPLHE